MMTRLVSDVLNLQTAPAEQASACPLPDVAHDSVANIPKTIDRVGMSGIEVALQWVDSQGVSVRTPARAEATVSLDDPAVKGIHMSRLFLALRDGLDDQPMTPAAIDAILDRFLTSHQGLSGEAFLAIEWEHLARRESLLSDLSGWRGYPIRVEAARPARQVGHLLKFRVTYSSTCPCSAALSRQLIQERFRDAFPQASIPVDEVVAWLGTQQAIAALPHSQRSHADITVRLAVDQQTYPIEELIAQCEGALGTAVQTAVKRLDEQEFARLNAEQLMFCEDAARILARALDYADGVTDYLVRIQHLESLHPHDAIAVISKGIPGGLTADR